MGFRGQTGWWTSITAGDFDGDGKLDLAVGNWGRNSSYELFKDAKLAVFYGDWNSDGKIALIEAWQQETNWLPVHNRAWLAGISRNWQASSRRMRLLPRRRFKVSSRAV